MSWKCRGGEEAHGPVLGRLDSGTRGGRAGVYVVENRKGSGAGMPVWSTIRESSSKSLVVMGVVE
jgi:hypothetical protein